MTKRSQIAAGQEREVPAVERDRSPFTIWWFTSYLRRYFKRNFHGVRVAQPGAPVLPADKPVIIYCNHPSWWDPALIAMLAARLFPERRSFGPIDADALKKYRFMRRIGLFGIEPGTKRGAAEFLRTSEALLSAPDTMLWITAEGEFRDTRARPLALRPGLAHLARRIDNTVLVPLALEYPFWNERTPEALARFGAPIPANAIRSVEQWQNLLDLRLAKTMDALAEDAMTRDPERFKPLLQGRVGVGGVYDLMRRLGAWSEGRRFSASHGDKP